MRTQRILKIIAQKYEVTFSELCTHNKRSDQRITAGKQTAAYMLKRHTDMSNIQIAQVLDWKSKANVIMSRKSVINIASGNKAEKERLDQIDKLILGD